ncbi:MAG TPA: hypothetical protein VFH95_09010 [Candidatus Kapabacteria bacterium]|nr:hypothetical protein [Candidatus Kapabacteria bacterium]
MRFLLISTLLLCFAISAAASTPAKRSFERHIRMKGFDGTVCLTELPENEVEVRIRTWTTTCDTVSGSQVYLVFAHGVKERFFFGHFGESPLPMLIFAISDAEDPQTSRAVAYEVTPRGALIGQQVACDESITHGHTDDVPSGQYALTAIDGKLGAIYSIASQDARFERYFVRYEKLRVRQWDPAINSFIETDQGFLRDRDGRLMQSARFDSWTDEERWDVFAANIGSAMPWMVEEKAEAKVIPASAER